MKNNALLTKVSGPIKKIGFKVKKHSPEILILTGVTGMVVSTVLACKATTKAGEIFDKAKEDIEIINQVKSDESKADEYSRTDEMKDRGIVYLQAGTKLAKLYGPALIVGVASITCVLASNNILRKRSAALAAAYATIDNGFKEYRERVVDRFGEEIDKELKYNVKAKNFEETIVDDKGKEKKITKTVKVIDGLEEYSQYARFFDEASPYWEKNSEYNTMFLNAQQQYANDLLRANGHLFLNEVYDMLGIPRSKAGQIVGWTYGGGSEGDEYVDFGIYDCNRMGSRDFVNGYERSILLDFNVDGNILDEPDFLYNESITRRNDPNRYKNEQ